MFAKALADAGTPFEMHVYPHGYHGASLGTPIVGWGRPTALCAWMNDSIRWMNSIKVEKPE